jgi:hypothetical protein
VPFRISIAWIPVSFFFLILLHFLPLGFPNLSPISPTFCASKLLNAPCARNPQRHFGEPKLSFSLFQSPALVLTSSDPGFVAAGSAATPVFFPSIQFSPSRPLTKRLFSTPLQLPFAAADSGQRQGRAPATCRAPAHAAKRLCFFRHHHTKQQTQATQPHPSPQSPHRPLFPSSL